MTFRVYGENLAGPKRREHRAGHTQPNLAVIRDGFRLKTGRRERRAGYSHADPAVVLDFTRWNFHGADVFHGNLRVVDNISPR
jgi:hypothetical protein